MSGDDYFNSDDFQELLAKYENAEASQSPIFLDADDLADLADYYNSNGEADKATQIIDSAIEKFPGAASPLFYKAREALRKEDLQAARHFAELIDDKAGIDYSYLQVEMLLVQEKGDEAESLANEFCETCSDEDDREDFIYDMTQLFVDYGYYEKALDWLPKIDDTDEADYKELKARALMGIGRIDESIKCYDELIDANPYSSNYWNAYASAQMLNDDMDAALKACGYALAINPSDSQAKLTEATCFFNVENFEQAIKSYKEYLRMVPTDEIAELNLGVCLLNTQHSEEAIEHLESALKKGGADSPQLPNIYAELAYAYGDTNNDKKAMEYIEKCLEQDSEHVQAKMLKGNLLMKNGFVDKAVNVFMEVIDAHPDDDHLWICMFVAFYENGYVEESYGLFDKFLPHVSDDFDEGYSYMALCCHDLRKTQKFKKYLKLAVEKNPAEAKDVLGFLFPEGTKPEDYYDYYMKQINNDKRR